MKRMIIEALLLLALLAVSANFLKGIPQDVDWDKDNYGILNLQIVDAETREPVKERFFISINDSKVQYVFQIRRLAPTTDDNGYFSCKLKPGTYLLYTFPKSKTSKYCWDKNPIDFPEEKHIITIERGKITKSIKSAYLAGRLKLIMISKEGERINPQKLIGDKADCSVQISAKSLIDNMSALDLTEGDDFNDGEILINSLFPDVYELEIDFDGLGIGSIYLKGIKVESKTITEVKVIVDYSNNTGVQGVISYEDGEPIINVEVGVGGPQGNSEETITASVYTDKDGYYKIVGLKEGNYSVLFLKKIGEMRFLRIKPRHVIINNNEIVRLDVQVKKPK